MDNILSKISRSEMREFLESEVFKFLNNMYSDYKIERSFVRSYEDMLNHSSKTKKMPMPENTYLFRSITDLEDEGERWSEENLFVVKVSPTTYQFEYMNYDIYDADEEKDTLNAVVSILKQPMEGLDNDEVSPSLVYFVAAHLDREDREEYKKFVNKKVCNFQARERRMMKGLFRLADTATESEQDG